MIFVDMMMEPMASADSTSTSLIGLLLQKGFIITNFLSLLASIKSVVKRRVREILVDFCSVSRDWSLIKLGKDKTKNQKYDIKL